MSPTIRRIALCVALAALAVPACASAATVRMRSIPGNGHDMEPPSSRMSIAAPSGERNVLTIELEAAGTWLVSDSGTALIAGDGCAALDATTARCTNIHPLVRNPGVEVDSGDRDDVVAVAQSVNASVRAGTGDDSVSASGILDGGPGNDTLVGGAGSDTLAGGTGRDVLRAGAGDDSLRADGGPGDSDRARLPARGRDRGFVASAEDDVIDGGEGQDTVDYGTHRSGVVVDLMDGRSDGGRGERDRLLGIENVIAGAGDDVLRGTAAANSLTGAGGRDWIDGRAGPDTLEDGDGADVLRGGPGNDQLYAHNGGDRLSGDGGNDKLAGFARRVHLAGGAGNDELAPVSTPASVSCGSGLDLLSTSGYSSRRPLAGLEVDDCERLITGGQFVAIRPRRGPGPKLQLAVQCRKTYPRFPTSNCRGDATVRLLRRGRAPITLGSGSYDVVAGTSGAVQISMPAGRRRALAAQRRPLVEVTVTVTQVLFDGRDYVAATYRWRVHLARGG